MQFSRRSFIQGAGALAAASVAGTALASVALAEDAALIPGTYTAPTCTQVQPVARAQPLAGLLPV
ncbi:MAG: twin-arginine translocation signal domain-containing protein [Coriobacteriales bacterium]|nr:twin-arginine translocation signal domain-containing protein [Coriobacteriales bacterium]